MTFDLRATVAERRGESFRLHSAHLNPQMVKVLRTISYAHPVYTEAGAAAQRRHGEISGPHTRTHYCGAYWGWGFHEDGVVSGLRVAARFGARL